MEHDATPTPPNPGLQAWLVRRDRCNQVPIADILTALNAQPRQDGDPQKWKILGLGNIWVKGQGWKNLNLDNSGMGGVRLVEHALNLAPGAAVKWIEQRWDTENLRALTPEEEPKPQEFSPPEPGNAVAIAEVQRYLVQERGLPLSLIESEIKRGGIYATHPTFTTPDGQVKPLAHKVNCVFLGPASAELRSTSDDFKGCCAGSDPDISGYRVPQAAGTQEKSLALVEAAIDALSYRSLYPGRFTVSTNGAGRFELPYRMAVEASDHGYTVHLGQDADDAGDIGAQKIFNAFYLRKMLSHSLGVEPEEVDRWLLTDAIELHPRCCPQEMFFHRGWEASVPVMHQVLVDPSGHERRWEPTGEMGPLQIQFTVRKQIHAKLSKGAHTTPVSSKGFEYVTQTAKVVRERPMHEKDWNGELKRLGSAYVRAYESAAKDQFAQGYPALPEALEAFRVPGTSMKEPEQQVIVPPSATAPSTPLFQRKR